MTRLKCKKKKRLEPYTGYRYIACAAEQYVRKVLSPLVKIMENVIKMRMQEIIPKNFFLIWNWNQMVYCMSLSELFQVPNKREKLIHF